MKKVLFINPFGIGDVLFSLYSVEALQRARPGVRVDLLCNERVASLARLHSGLTRVYEFDRDALRATRSKAPLSFARAYAGLVSEWRRERYDAVFDHSLGREFSFLALLAGIRSRFGFDYKNRGHFLSGKLPFGGYEGVPVAETQLGLLRLAGVAAVSPGGALAWRIPDGSRKRAESLLADARVRSWMALAPGGGASWGADAVYKQWDPERFAEAASAWAEKSGAGVLLVGDRSEKDLLESVRARLRVGGAVVCGEGLDTVSALLARTRFLLANDGGLVHLAHSLGVPTVAIYGPVDEKVYGPFGDGAPHRKLSAEVPCRPCYTRFHFPPCPHRRRCLTELSVQKVLESMDKIA